MRSTALRYTDCTADSCSGGDDAGITRVEADVVQLLLDGNKCCGIPAGMWEKCENEHAFTVILLLLCLQQQKGIRKQRLSNPIPIENNTPASILSSYHIH